ALGQDDAIDEATREYLLTSLAEADRDEWREIAEAFLSPELAEKLLALAPAEGVGMEPTRLSSLAAPVSISAVVVAAVPALPVETKAWERPTPGWERPKPGDEACSRKDKGVQAPRKDAPREEAIVTVRQTRQGENNSQARVLNVDIKDLSVSFGGRSLMTDAHLRLQGGHRYGFVGANGAGKSTLLRLMSARRIPGYPDLETLLVEQEDVGDERNPVETVLSANRSLSRLRREEALLTRGLVEAGAAVAAHQELLLGRAEVRVAELELDCRRLLGARGKEASAGLLQAEKEVAKLRRGFQEAKEKPAASDDEAQAVSAACASLLEDVKEALADLNEERLRAKAVKVLLGLGLQGEQLREATSGLSGGWRMRVAIAQALFLEPQVLILDEPTNHLDWGSMIWLEEHLATLDKIILVVVSHDRQFLDGFSTDILRLAKGQLHVFKGNYSDYETTSALLHRSVEKEEQKHTSVGSVRRRRTAAPLEFDHDVHLFLDVGPKLRWSGTPMQCRGLVLGYPGLQLTSAFDLSLDLTSRVAVIGHNGSGKTTLLRTLSLEHPPLAGEVYIHPSLRVGYFSQHQAQELPFDKTCLEMLTAFGEGVKEMEAKEHLASFGLDERHAKQKIGTLSGGEKSRLALARITIKQPHILLLDEPSNHLDLLTVVALGDALQAFEGGILLVSHDRRLIKEVCPEAHQQYLLDGGALTRADGLSKFVRSVKVAVKKDAHG
ncbi:unnamed protein product, partial [Polarella glacialis]